MEVKLAKTAGFCYGVQRAVDMVTKVACEGRRHIYTYGPIVHNENVIEALREKGVDIIDDFDMLRSMLDRGELEGSTIVIRAHGVPKAVFELIEKSGLDIEVIDATCPHVKRIHDIVKEQRDEGDVIAVCGDPEHPEVIGILGQIEDDAYVIKTREDAERLELPEDARLTLVSQTTQSVTKFQDIVDILHKKRYYTNVIDTICNATQRRQSEASGLAHECDAMLVIGGSNSSNTRKLYDICHSECQRTYLIQSITDIKGTIDHSVRCVGITAGASTPRSIIEEVFEYVRNEF